MIKTYLYFTTLDWAFMPALTFDGLVFGQDAQILP